MEEIDEILVRPNPGSKSGRSSTPPGTTHIELSPRRRHQEEEGGGGGGGSCGVVFVTQLASLRDIFWGLDSGWSGLVTASVAGAVQEFSFLWD